MKSSALALMLWIAAAVSVYAAMPIWPRAWWVGYTEIIHESAALTAATARLAEELNAQCTIGYTPAHPPDGTYHFIRVHVPGKKYVGRARRGDFSSVGPR